MKFSMDHSGYDRDLQPPRKIFLSFPAQSEQKYKIEVFSQNIGEIFPFRAIGATSDMSRAALALMSATLQQQNYNGAAATEA